MIKAERRRFKDTKRIKSFLQDWFPPIAFRALMRTVSKCRYLAYPNKSILLKNKKLKDRGKGSRCFLIATGPSIKQENLKLLEGEDCFTTSNFFLHQDIQVVNPKFHNLGFFHSPLILENYVDWLRKADNALPLSTNILLGHTAYDIVQQFKLFNNREVYYQYLSFSAYPPRGMVDLTKPILSPQSAPLMLLPLMVYMGYERIYLLGCDNTQFRDYKREVSNFYNPEQDLRQNATGANVWSGVEIEFKANLLIFEQYRHYQNMLRNSSAKIINLSTDSWIDVFPFDRLENIIHRDIEAFS